MLIHSFKNSFLTSTLDAAQHEVLAMAMFERNFTAEESIIKYGDNGSEYYILVEGAVKVFVY